MPKPKLVCLSVIAVLMASFALMQAAASQNCIPQFAIYSAESVDGTPANFIWVQVDVKNIGSCAGSATVSAQYPENWLASTFTTGEIQPGSIDDTQSIKVIIPSGAKSSIINFTAPGANSTSTKIIIGGLPIEEKDESVQEQPVQQNHTQNPLTDKSALPINVTTPEAQPQAEQTTGVTGLVTANPAAQIAIFAILLFGAGYMLARIKGEGFRYRFKR